MESSLKIKRHPYRLRNTLHFFDASCIQSTGLRIEIPGINIFRFQTVVCILCVPFKDTSRLWTKWQRHKFKGRNTHSLTVWLNYWLTFIPALNYLYIHVLPWNVAGIFWFRIFVFHSLGYTRCAFASEAVTRFIVCIKERVCWIEIYVDGNFFEANESRGKPSYLHKFPVELN